jgi:hypothetical protein
LKTVDAATQKIYACFQPGVDISNPGQENFEKPIVH